MLRNAQVRGRSIEEGVDRWFRRIDATTFDQADIRGEADAFAAFVDGAVTGYGLDPDRLAFLGYSNGANLLAAVLGIHPGVVRRAVLLRAVQVLEDPEAADLSGTSVLVLDGRDDLLARAPSGLADNLKANGANVEARVLSADHALSAADVTVSREWLRRNLSGAASFDAPVIQHEQPGNDESSQG